MKEFGKIFSITDENWITRAPGLNTIDSSSIILDTGGEKQKSLFDYLSAIELFRTQRNSAAGLMAFANSYKAGIYPPEDLLEWLSDGITRWVDGQGKVNLEKILKLSKQASGSTRAIDRVIKYQRNIEIATELRHLIENFALSQEEAAEMIEKRMIESKDPLKILASTIISDILPLMRQMEREHRFIISSFSEKQAREFLAKYPHIDKHQEKIQKALSGLKK